MSFDPLCDMHTKYLRFTEIPYVATSGRKTRSWLVFSTRSGDLLGRVKWFGRWRQYAFFPEPDTIWNPDCLHAIQLFIAKAMADWRERKNKPVDSAVGG